MTEADPSILEEFVVLHLILSLDTCVHIGVFADFAEVLNVEIPGEVSDKVVHGDARGVPETLIVRVERDLNSLGNERSSGMCAQVIDVAESLVTHWTDLKTNVVFNNLLDQVRVFS